MEINERWLGDIAGWQVLKAARALLARGVVADAVRTDDAVRGYVSEGPKRYQAGLTIRSRTDVENLCTCPASRGRGLICAHSIAVALATMQQRTPAGGLQSMRPPAVAPHRGDAVSAAPQTQPAEAPKPAPGRFAFYIAGNVLTGSFMGQAAVFMKFEPGNGAASDAGIVEWLRSQGLKPGSMPLMLTRRDLAGLFTACMGHHSVFAGKPSSSPPAEDARIAVADTTLRLPVSARDEAGDVGFALDSTSLKQLADAWCWCSATRSVFPLPTLSDECRKLVFELFTNARCTRSLPWLIDHRATLDDAFNLRLEGSTLASLRLVPLPCEFELSIDGSMQSIEAKLHATFGGKRWIVMDGSLSEVAGIRFPMQAPDSPARFYSRNIERERAAADRLFDLGFQAVSSTTLRLQGQDKVARFYASELPRLQRVFIIDESQRWRSATRGLLRITPKVREPEDAANKHGQDWLSLDIAYEAPDGFRITRSEVMQLIRSGRRGLTGPDGRNYLIDEDACEEFEDSLRDLDGEMTASGVRVRADKSQFLFTIDDTTFAAKQSASWQSEDAIKSQLPDLAPLLRPYQVDGIRWLESCARGSHAGLLADDMGLGKTLQAIALIRLLDRTGSPETGPALVVCPKSLIANWEREIERFAPALRVLTIHGAGRHDDFAQITQHDVVITTYQLIARDLSRHRAHTYAALVLDEASQIRNPDTEAAKALRAIKAERRFALTGTPLENGVRDLWSIYQFLLPGYLGSRDNFRDRFEKPLASGPATPAARKAADRLRKLVRPHFLRRTKQEVLKDLPEKIEQVLWCDLSRAQTEVYRRLLEEGHAEVRAARKRSGNNGAKMTMFTVLLRLRQVCCHLKMTGMADQTLAALPPDDLSGKLAVWRERLTEIIGNGGKIIIFSQFVKFLHLLRSELEQEKIPFCYLDGQSNDRAAQVQRFQEDTSVQAFLISLKAGGYGLNLTAADHVMLMDPWWNPAVEAQAIDRAHRMGQQRVVTALRLVTRGTVEEKILKLQDHKRGLIEAALDDDQPMMAGLSEEDLEQVLEG